MKSVISLAAIMSCSLSVHAQVATDSKAEGEAFFSQLDSLQSEIDDLRDDVPVIPPQKILQPQPGTQALVDLPLPTGGALPVPAFQRQAPAKPVISMVPNVPFKMEMVRINPGTFVMGSDDFEVRRERTEGPRQSVNIGYVFEVGKYEVTFDQWDTCVKAGGCNQYSPLDGDWGRGTRPVINVSWDDAQHFIKWLSATSGQSYRLLSEAEWEYVARAGTVEPFHTGQMITSKQANINGEKTYLGSPVGVYLRKTAKVGSYEPNAFGLHDLIGNAYEWTQDCWHDSHNGAPNDGSAREDGNCKFRVMKGGSWVSHPDQVRLAARTQYVTNFRYDDYGFRVARTVEVAMPQAAPAPMPSTPYPAPLPTTVPQNPNGYVPVQ